MYPHNNENNKKIKKTEIDNNGIKRFTNNKTLLIRIAEIIKKNKTIEDLD
jgi:hypothetical protein